MVSTLTDRNHALYIDVPVTNRSAVALSINTQTGLLDILTGRFRGRNKNSKKLLSRCREKDVCLIRGFEAKKAEVAVPRLAVQLGTALRKAQSLVNVGGGVDFIQANMFLDPAHLN